MDLNWNTPIGEIVFLPVYGSSESKDEYEDSTYTDDDGVKWWALGGHQDKMREKSVELRLSSNEGAFMEYIIGLYYYDRFWRKGGETLGYLYGDGKTRQVLGPYNYRDMDNENKAAFANLKFPISNAFRLSAGGRYTADKESDYSYNPVPRNPADPIESWEDYSSSHFDYKLGFEYDLNQDAMLWGDYATGYKAIVMSGQSQTLKSYQIGVKSRIFDQKLQLNATAWYYDYMNFDVDTSKAYYSEGVQYSDRGTGIGDGTLYGLDVSSDYVLTENDLMNLSVAYMFSEISDMLITYQDYYPPDRVLEGMTLNNSPEWSITASYEHRFNLRNGGSLTPKFNILYQTEKTVTFFPEAMFFPGIDVNKANTEPAHHISGASLLYNEPNRKWNLNAYVKNIENHAEKVSMHAVWFRIGEPRTYGIVVSVKF